VARLPLLKRDELDADVLPIWDLVMTGRRSVGGPNACIMHHPALAERVYGLGSQLRQRGLLPGADRELTILTSGREMQSPFEWVGHERLAIEAGTRREAIEVVRNQQPTTDLLPREATVVDLVRALFREHDVPADLYARAEAEFGRQQLVEMVVLAGYYGLISFVIHAFDVDFPAGVTPAFGP
jgi:4-carboxymuconolactone decarboxylase